MPQCRGTHVTYSLAMPMGPIDREAWAREVQQLIVRFDPGPKGTGNKSAFARRVKVTTRTIERWIAQENDVKVETVRALLTALNLSRQESVELLGRIGFHLGGSPVMPDPDSDPVIQRIKADPAWNDEQRKDLIEAQVERIKDDTRRRMEEYERFATWNRAS
ncbi:hypothetical protein FHX34_103546 [Actinoplanes teichomyceticus]|uniref:Helix-turn-helix protein n=2 Tax=Actinoplanes teichomyceticus TaxID=1867 RepID=A0A561WAX3_ACTTI|nr:hypothetical protein FHX34_103546 [Actinoplanes teichomyceticus]